MDPSSAVTKLLASGMTEQVIAAAINVNQSTVNRIRNRVVAPSYEVGAALVAMASSLPAKRKAKRQKPARLSATAPAR